MIKTLKSWLPSKRKLMQLYFALLFNANIKGFFNGSIYKGGSKYFCAPGLNCYSCPGAVSACPVGALQNAFSSGKSALFYVAGILLLYGLIFGRFICGWLCPFGFIQELFYKIKTPKLKKSPLTKALRYVKYALLVFFVVLIPIGYAVKDIPLPAFCKYICPAGTLEGGVALLSNRINAGYFSMLGPLFTWKFFLLVAIMVGSIFIFRLFCRFLCPLGALYGLFNRYCLVGVRVDAQKCVSCGLCSARCKMDIRHVGDAECISCGECINTCPTGAIRFQKPYISRLSASPKKRQVFRAVTAVLMALVLLGALSYYWVQSAEVVSGNQTGTACYGYDLQRIDETGILSQTVNPANTGKITVINFWGTWCSPCLEELPYLDQIATDYAAQVTVIAVHTHMQAETAGAYVGQHYKDSPIIFAKDFPQGYTEGYYSLLGGRDTYPYTLVLDSSGIITHIFHAPVAYADLSQAIESNLK